MKRNYAIITIISAMLFCQSGTGFAAANPFSDVPAGNWAYEAISQLAGDGIINGYPQGTFDGNKMLTRYEMAQLIAKAMTKNDIDKADKALVDKLSAEFSEELDNLGVRVADLEKKSDSVKWGGRFRYYYRGTKDDSAANKDRSNDTVYEFRLEPKAFIGNTGWTANGRIRYFSNAASANNGGSTNGVKSDGTPMASDKSDTTIDMMYVSGPLFGGIANMGKVPTYSDLTFGTGMIIDSAISGAEFNWNLDKNKSNYLKTTIGRYDYSPASNIGEANYAYDGTSDYAALEIGHKAENKGLSAMAGYYSLRNMSARFSSQADPAEDKNNFWVAGLGYKFGSNLQLFGLYAKSNMDAYAAYNGDDQSKAYDITLKYKNINLKQAGSWDIYTSYRYLGQFATISPTYHISARDTKGLQIGTDYVIAKNILAMLEYYKGKRLSADYGGNDADYNAIYGRVEFFF